MPLGVFDISMCPNKECPHWSENPPCGRSLKNFEGLCLVLSFCCFKPESDGTCKNYMEPTDWKSQIEPWMLEQGKRYAESYQAECDRQQKLKDAQALDADDLDKEV